MTPNWAPAMQWWTGKNAKLATTYILPQIDSPVLANTIATRVSMLMERSSVSIGDGMHIENIANDNIAIRANKNVLPSHALDTGLRFAQLRKWNQVRIYHPDLPLTVDCHYGRQLPIVFSDKHSTMAQFRNHALATARMLTMGRANEIMLSAVYDPTPERKNGTIWKIRATNKSAEVVGHVVG